MTDQPEISDSHTRPHRAWRIVLLSFGVVAGVAAVAAAVDHYFLNSIQRWGNEHRLVFHLDAPYGSVDLRGGTNPNVVATIETLTEDAEAHNSQWSYGVQNGTVGMLRIGIGTDEGMKGGPPLAMWQANSGFYPAAAMAPQPDWGAACPSPFYSFAMPAIPFGYVWRPRMKVISTDGGIVITPEARAGTRISLTRDLPMDIVADLGFGESTIDLTGLSITNAAIGTGASRATIQCRAPNPVRLHNYSLRAGIGQCICSGISNLNADNFSFNGAVGSYHLGFEGKLTHNLDATVEIGLGMCSISIPPTAGRVQVFYDDGLLSSFSFSGLAALHDGWERSPGFNLSSAPVLTLHLSSGAGKISVSYH